MDSLASSLGDVVMQPLGAHLTVGTAEVTVVVGRHMLQHSIHSLCLDLFEEWFNKPLVPQFGQIYQRSASVTTGALLDTLLSQAGQLTSLPRHGTDVFLLRRVEVLVLGDVHELLSGPA